MPQHTSTWKNAEKKAAEIIKGKRVNGARGEGIEDVEHPYFSIEVKHGKCVPKFVTDAYHQAKRNAPAGKVPVVVLHPHGSPEYMAVLPLSALAELFSKAVTDGGIDLVALLGYNAGT